MTKLLFVLTSHGTLGDTGRSTGWYLPEVAHPYTVLAASGWQVDFASPRGGEPPMDGGDRADQVSAAFLQSPGVTESLANTVPTADVDPHDYAGVFLAGGHGTMWDFPTAEGLARIVRGVWQDGGVVAGVCHGPAGLVDVRLSNGTYLVAGRQVAAFTNLEEEAVGLTDTVPFLLQDRLAARGAAVVTAPNFAENVVVDGRLVTGQNPASASPMAVAMAKVLHTLRQDSA